MQPPRGPTLSPAPALAIPAQGRLLQGLALAVPAGLALNLGLAVLVLGQGTGALLAGMAYMMAALLVCAGMRRHYPHGRIGACNAVTLMRLAMATALIAPLPGGQAAGWAVATVAAIALALDGVDGSLARRSGLCSGFGARFDMEVDAGLALILSLHALQGSPVGAGVLVLGVMRYLFIGASVVLPWMLAPLPHSWRRKTVCVLQLAALIALQIPQLPPDSAILLMRLAAATLVWSFARDVRWLWKRR